MRSEEAPRTGGVMNGVNGCRTASVNVTAWMRRVGIFAVLALTGSFASAAMQCDAATSEKRDIVFFLDNSGSIDDNEFAKMWTAIELAVKGREGEDEFPGLLGDDAQDDTTRIAVVDWGCGNESCNIRKAVGWSSDRNDFNSSAISRSYRNLDLAQPAFLLLRHMLIGEKPELDAIRNLGEIDSETGVPWNDLEDKSEFRVRPDAQVIIVHMTDASGMKCDNTAIRESIYPCLEYSSSYGWSPRSDQEYYRYSNDLKNLGFKIVTVGVPSGDSDDNGQKKMLSAVASRVQEGFNAEALGLTQQLVKTSEFYDDQHDCNLSNYGPTDWRGDVCESITGASGPSYRVRSPNTTEADLKHDATGNVVQRLALRLDEFHGEAIGKAINSIVSSVRNDRVVELSASPEPSTIGDEVTFTARVSGVGGDGEQQIISFYRKGDDDEPVALCEDVELSPSEAEGEDNVLLAECSVHFPRAKEYRIYALYEDACAGEIWSGDYTHVVDKSTASVALQSPLQVGVGSTIAVQAVVAGFNPTGTVQFSGTGCTARPLTPIPGSTTQAKASCIVTFGSLGSVQIDVTYLGDANNTPANTTVEIAVGRHETSVELTLDPGTSDPIRVGDQVTLKAEVTGYLPAAGNPSVRFLSGEGSQAVQIACDGDDPVEWVASPDPATAGTKATATCKTSFAMTGTYSLRVEYNNEAINDDESNDYVGNPNNTEATSAPPLSLTVHKHDVDIGLTSSPDASALAYAGQEITLVASISEPVAGGTGAQTVRFRRGNTTIPDCGAVVLNSERKAVCDTTLGSGSSDTITARFSGDTNNAPVEVTQTITLRVAPRVENTTWPQAGLAGKMGWRFTLAQPGTGNSAGNVKIEFPAGAVQSIAFVPNCETKVVNGVVEVVCDRPAVVGITCAGTSATVRSCTVNSLTAVAPRTFFVVPAGSGSVTAVLSAGERVVGRPVFNRPAQ